MEAANFASELSTPEPRPLRELAALRELPRLALAWPRLRRGRGAPRAVMVVPGFMTTDASTFVFRQALRRAGHDVYGWELGRNRGNVEQLISLLRARVEAIDSTRRLHLVGWSLGGYLAREVARERPDRVEQVITLGSPVVGGPKYTAAATTFRDRLGADLDAIEREVEARNAVPLRVPVTALYSERDAVVCPAACIDRHSPSVEHIRVDTSHAGFGFSASVVQIVLDRLHRS